MGEYVSGGMKLLGLQPDWDVGRDLIWGKRLTLAQRFQNGW